ncbi:MAG: hypothetical protein ACD_75C02433G0001, partial [uncultured bacterium]
MLPQRFLPRKTIEPLACRVPENNAALPVIALHRDIGNILKQGTESFFAFLKRLFGLLALGDIGVGAEHPQGAAGGVVFHHLAEGEDPFPLPRFGLLPELYTVLRSLARDVIVIRRGYGFPVSGVQPLDPFGVGLMKFIRIVFEHGGVFRTDRGLAGLDIEVVESLVGSHERQAKLFFPCLQLRDEILPPQPVDHEESQQGRGKWVDCQHRQADLGKHLSGRVPRQGEHHCQHV